MFLQIPKTMDILPFETNTDKEHDELLSSLRSEIAKSFKDLENGRVYSISEVRTNLGY